METFLTSAGIKSKAGQLVRLLNLPLEKAQQFHGYKSGKDHADALKAAYRVNHGAAGREWIRYLAHHQKEAIQAVREAESRWRSLIPSNYGEQVHRVAERLAILEAALLVGRTITGMLTPPTSGRGFQRKSPRIDGRQFNVYVIHYMPEEEATQE